MSTRTHSCVTVVCDGCATTPDSDSDQGELHYSSAAEAERDLVDDMDPERSWEVTGDRHLCPDCLCRRDGHRWDQPLRCRCDGAIRLPGHGQGCRVMSRYCRRCDRLDDIIPSAEAGAR